jgi:NAD(P)H-dependent FMN reductase
VTLPVHILLVSGSLRAGSTNTAALRTAIDVGAEGVAMSLYEGLRELPHFDPGDDQAPLPQPVIDLRAALGIADAILFCTPEYAGTLPGSFKNLLDWGVGGGELYEKPVAWVNISTGGPTGAAGAHQTVGVVLGYCGSRIVEDACAHVPIQRSDLGDDGLVHDEDIRARLRASVEALAAVVPLSD